MKRKGFTLIELLVVIAIIALLLSVLIPSLGKAKTNARTLVCRTNIKSLGTGIFLYLESNNQKFFPYVNSLWLLHMQDHLGDIDKIRYCPETVKNVDSRLPAYMAGETGVPIYMDDPWIWTVTTDTTKEYEQGSYGINGWLYGDVNKFVPANMKSAVYQSVNDIKTPTNTPVFVDSYWVDSWPQNTNKFQTGFRLNRLIWTSGITEYSMERFLPNRHKNESCNMFFLDGHAEMPKMIDFWRYVWHKGARPNFDIRMPADAGQP